MDKKFIKRFSLVLGIVVVSISSISFFYGRSTKKTQTQENMKIYCVRSAPYTIPIEFTHALQLITQSTIRHFQTNNPFSFLSSLANCLDIQYADVSQASEYFLYDSISSTPTHMKIYADYSYPFHNNLITAFLLTNRVWRAKQSVEFVGSVPACDAQEAYVHKAEAFFAASLSSEQRQLLTTYSTTHNQDQRENNVLQSVRFALDKTSACGHKPQGCTGKDIDDVFAPLHFQSPADSTECIMAK